MKKRLGYKSYFYLFAFQPVILLIVAVIVSYPSEKPEIHYLPSAIILLLTGYYIYLFARNLPVQIEYDESELRVKFLIKKYNKTVKLTDIKDIIYPGKGYMSMFAGKLPDEAILVQYNNNIIPLWLNYYSGLNDFYANWINKYSAIESFPRSTLHISKQVFKCSAFSVSDSYLSCFVIICALITMNTLLDMPMPIVGCTLTISFTIIILYSMIRHLSYITLDENKLILSNGLFPFICRKFELNDIYKIIFLNTYADLTIQICMNDFKLEIYRIRLVKEKDVPKIIDLLKDSGIILINDLEKGIL